MPELFNLIQERYQNFTGIQRQVADYFLAHPDTLPFKRLEDVAGMIGVSTTSVIRFARALGFKGYGDMQQALQQSILNKGSLPQRLLNSFQTAKQDKLLVDSFQNDIQNIHDTLEGLSEQALSQAVEAIIGAESVYVLGIRGNFSVAHYLGYRLGQLKRGVRLVDGTALAYPEEVIGAQAGDVCVAFLTPRYSKMTANLVSWLKRRGVKIILFTRQGSTEIDPYGDIILPCKTDGISYKSSLVSLFCVCNYLLAAIALEDHDNAMETIAQTEELLGQGFFLGL